MFNLKKIIFLSFVFVLFFSFIFSWQIIKIRCTKSLRADYEKLKVDKYNKLKQCYKINYVNLVTKDGHTISSILVIRQNPKANLLIGHGYRQSKESLLSLLDIFDNYNVMLFDFRAHGSSSDSIISFGINESNDVEAACNFLKENHKTQKLPIIGLCMSMAGYAFLRAEYKHNYFTALILDSCFANLEKQLKNEFSKITELPNFLVNFCKLVFQIMAKINFNELNPVELISFIRIPILIIHTEKDTIVNINDAYDLYKAIKSKKEIWVSKFSEHIKLFKDYPILYREKINDFLNQII